jgi:hypothetical protein
MAHDKTPLITQRLLSCGRGLRIQLWNVEPLKEENKAKNPKEAKTKRK